MRHAVNIVVITMPPAIVKCTYGNSEYGFSKSGTTPGGGVRAGFGGVVIVYVAGGAIGIS